MLVMTRKPGEAIAIGDQVVVRVLGIEGGRVQLGIDAPREVRVTPAPQPGAEPAKK
jgi:carbon storage regulator